MRRRLELIADQDVEHLLFFSRNRTPLAPFNVRRSLREIFKAAGLEELKISPHSFRRTGATAITRGADLVTAAEFLGCTSTSVTREHYVEVEEIVNLASATILQTLAPVE
jgi:site-specific recombinase XerD